MSGSNQRVESVYDPMDLLSQLDGMYDEALGAHTEAAATKKEDDPLEEVFGLDAIMAEIKAGGGDLDASSEEEERFTAPARLSSSSEDEVASLPPVAAVPKSPRRPNRTARSSAKSSSVVKRPSMPRMSKSTANILEVSPRGKSRDRAKKAHTRPSSSSSSSSDEDEMPLPPVAAVPKSPRRPNRTARSSAKSSTGTTRPEMARMSKSTANILEVSPRGKSKDRVEREERRRQKEKKKQKKKQKEQNASVKAHTIGHSARPNVAARSRRSGYAKLLVEGTSGKCSKCATPCELSASFCKHCGSLLHKKKPPTPCPSCGKDVPASKPACSSCGTPVRGALKKAASPPPPRKELPTAKATIKARMIVLGSGPSSGIPSISCVMGGRPCRVCSEVMGNPLSKNNRRNPSVLVESGAERIMIDCGKTFREGWLNALRKHKGLKRPTAILITHGHADAFFGLDDVRELLARNDPSDFLHVYSTASTYEAISRTFPYLIDSTKSTGSGYVARLQFHTIPEEGRFTIGSVNFEGIRVPHGQDGSTCLAFRFGNVLYASDVSAVDQALLARFQGAQVLIIDALKLKEKHASHLNLSQAIGVVRALRPLQTVLTGMSHEFSFVDVTQKVLRTLHAKEQLVVEMGFDGKTIDILLD